jgi:hypothetical protein
MRRATAPRIPVHQVGGEYHRVELVRHSSDAHGWGRIDVEEIEDELGLVHVSKYVNKRRKEVLAAHRLWAKVGRWPEGRIPSRVKDIIVDSPHTRIWRAMLDQMGRPRSLQETVRRFRLVREVVNLLIDDSPVPWLPGINREFAFGPRTSDPAP